MHIRFNGLFKSSNFTLYANKKIPLSRWQNYIVIYVYAYEVLPLVVLISKWLQSDKKIKTLTDTAELIEDAVSDTFIHNLELQISADNDWSQISWGAKFKQNFNFEFKSWNLHLDLMFKPWNCKFRFQV